MRVIEVAGLCIRRDCKMLIDNADLGIRAGEVTTILGPNGAGKSTLLRCLSGTMRPDRGRVLFNGRDLSDYTASELALHRAVLGQEGQLAFGSSVTDVVRLGRIPHAGRSTRRTDLMAVAEAMQIANVEHLADRSFLTLSGGEKQRVHLARTLCQLLPWRPSGAAPQLLFLDEPTNNLDLSHQHVVLRHARKLARGGLGVVIVLHDPNLAIAYSDQIVLMQAGQIVAAGPTDEALTPERLSRVYGIPMRRISHPDYVHDLLVPAE
ncbi:MULTISPECIES: heme ABC transporter ATP-binding protein [unclassified Minwuia]|jgi:heme transport system ATP-binding protein|uniref:heme ABC transporter ATP-binding protein n=1 Tax=unclassified Minwuia TaxID=2618799 RepID=UPI0024786DD8|nr:MULTISPECIES: heme ABC transporter ATP-binding protein [unclassified Minwuia]